MGITRESERIYHIDNQQFVIFLYLEILPIFAYFSLDSTLLVHFDIPNFLVSLQIRKHLKINELKNLLGSILIQVHNYHLWQN